MFGMKKPTTLSHLPFQCFYSVPTLVCFSFPKAHFFPLLVAFVVPRELFSPPGASPCFDCACYFRNSLVPAGPPPLTPPYQDQKRFPFFPHQIIPEASPLHYQCLVLFDRPNCLTTFTVNLFSCQTQLTAAPFLFSPISLSLVG